MIRLCLFALAVEGAALVALAYRALGLVQAQTIPADWATDDRTLARYATLGRAQVPAQPWPQATQKVS